MGYSNSALFDKPDQVINNFVRCGFPYYAIFSTGGDQLWSNTEETNIQLAADLLSDDLEMIRPGNTGTFVIKHYAKVPEGGIKNKTEPNCISTFKHAKVEPEVANNSYQYNNMLMDELRSIRAELAQMKLERQMDLSDSDEDIREQAQPSNILGTILGNPDVQSMLANLLTNITANLITPHHTMNKPTALAGTNTEKPVTLEQILEKLFAKGVTLNDMYVLSEMPKEKLQSMLNMLRIM